MVWYNRGKHVILDPRAAGVGEAPLELLLDDIVIGLMKTSYTVDIDAHEQYDDISASGIVATNYVEPGNSGSHSLASKTIGVDNTNDRAEFDAADLVFSSIGNGSNDTFDQLVVARQQDASFTEANTELIAHSTCNATLTNGGNITLVWNAEGILHVTA